MNVVLIGFRGTGKTSVGKILAKKLNLKFIDADDYIEKRYGFTISEIFQSRGESLFRLMESDVINKLSKTNSCVIAAGGGAVLKYKNVKNLKRQGILILLEADSNTVYKRILKDDRTKTKRPALTQKELLQEIKDLMEFRQHYYQRAADYSINTTGKSLEKVADETLKFLKKAGFVK